MGLLLAGGGSSPAPSFPSWYPAVEAVAEIDSGTTIGSAVRAEGGNDYGNPDGSNEGGPDPDDIVEPWSGGALVYVSGQPYLAAYGGGHGDSAFNGIVKFGPLSGSGADSPTWSTFLAPSATSAVQDAATYTDGRQASIHSYNVLVGVSGTIYALQTPGYYSSGNSSDSAFSFTTSGQASIGTNPTTANYGAAAHYDGNLYFIGANTAWDRLRIYDISGDSWSSESNDDISLVNYIAGAVDTSRGVMLVVNGSTGVSWDLSNLTRTTGREAPTSYFNSLIYDPGRDAFVSPIDNSLSVRELDASALGGSWTTRTFTGTTPAAGPAAGAYGRFQYVPELKGYVYAPNLESHVYFYRSE